MFSAQISELRSMVEGKESDIQLYEERLKTMKEELRDVKQALSSLERVQAKYEPQEECDK